MNKIRIYSNDIILWEQIINILCNDRNGIYKTINLYDKNDQKY